MLIEFVADTKLGLLPITIKLLTVYRIDPELNNIISVEAAFAGEHFKTRAMVKSTDYKSFLRRYQDKEYSVEVQGIVSEILNKSKTAKSIVENGVDPSIINSLLMGDESW